MEIIFTESTGLYFYSALLQANAAIIALIGLYTIFRIQASFSYIDSIRNYFFSDNILRDYGIKFDEKTLEQKEEYLKEDKTTGSERISIQRWYNNLLLIKEMERGIKILTILIGVALILDSIFLFLSSSLHQSDKNYEIICAVLNLLYEIILVTVISFKVINLVTLKSSSD